MYSVTLWLHFLQLDVTTHSERLYHWVTEHYSSLNQTHLFPEHSARFTVELEEIGSEHELDIPSAVDGTFTNFGLVSARCYFENGAFYSHDTGKYAHAVEVNVETNRMRANVGGDLIAFEESFIYNVFRDVLRKLIFPLNRLFSLHGSAVTDGARTILFCGESGSGKSTLALKMREQGFRILSDDRPVFTTYGGSTLLLSSLDELSVTDNTLRLFPHLQARISRRREVSGKFFINRKTLGDENFDNGPHVVTDYVILNRGEFAEAQLLELDKMKTAGDLIKENMFFFSSKIQSASKPDIFKQTTNFMFSTMTQLFEHARVYELRYSNSHLNQIHDILSRSGEKIDRSSMAPRVMAMK